MTQAKKFLRSLAKILVCTTLSLLALIVVVVGLVVILLPGEANYNSTHHPFTSPEAREAFLEAYDDRAKLWPVPTETTVVNTDRGQTFVRINGKNDAKTLVLLHGVSGNSLQWLPNIEELSKTYRVYAIDIIGDNGRSVSRQEIVDADDYTEWLNNVFDELKIRNNINLVGLSYGGWIASQYALKHSSRLDKLVLVAPVGTVAQLSKEWIVRAITVAIPVKYFTKNFMYWIAEDTVKSGAEGKGLIDKHIDDAFLAVRSFTTKNMVTPTILTDEQLQNFDIPVLFLVGENEKIFSAEQAIKRLHSVAPNIQTRLIRNAGHDLTMVEAGSVNAAIQLFVD